MIHPQTYHETFGINYVYSQAAGCLPITVDAGAAHEVINNYETGFITKGKTIYNKECYKEFIEIASECFSNDPSYDLYKMRLKAYGHAQNWNLLNTAKRFLEIL